MKALVLFLFIAIVVGCATQPVTAPIADPIMKVAPQEKYEGVVSPYSLSDTEQWEFCNAQPIGDTGGAVLFFKSLDPRAPVTHVITIIDPSYNILAYCYMFEGKLRYFCITETDGYVERTATGKARETMIKALTQFAETVSI